MTSRCLSNGSPIVMYAHEGQTLNISLLDLSSNVINGEDTYGTLNDPSAKKRILFGKGPRSRHLMTTISNTVEINYARQALDLCYVYQVS